MTAANDDQNHTIHSDGARVWVNGRDRCIGRLSETGFEVFDAKDDEDTFGRILECRRGPLAPSDWTDFADAMRRHHGTEVPEDHRPHGLQPN